MFDYDFSDEFIDVIKKLKKKYPKRADIIKKKVNEIVSQTPESIIRYKNLRHDLKAFKRVHVDRHFVMVFKVDFNSNFITFLDIDHHDNVYKK